MQTLYWSVAMPRDLDGTLLEAIIKYHIPKSRR